MSNRAKSVYLAIKKAIDEAVKPLSDTDYVDVLEAIVDNIDMQVQAKLEEQPE